MACIITKSKYHCALDGLGLILQGGPNRLGYEQKQSPTYGNRFASGDRDYNDLSQWWYFMQTDWSGGVKESTSWANDAKHYYSTNIDTWSEIGAIKLSRNPALLNTFSENIICGCDAAIDSVVLSTDDVYPASNVATVAGYGWTDPTNAYSDNGSYASCANGASKNHTFYNFSVPSIPTGSTITGIKVTVKAYGTSSAYNLGMNLTKTGDTSPTTIIGYNRNTGAIATSPTVYELGGQNDLWGASSISIDDVRSTGFGVSYVAMNGSPVNGYIDYIKIKIYYKSPSSSATIYVGTDESSSNKPIVYAKNGESWDDKTSTFLTSTDKDYVSYVGAPTGVLWALYAGAGTTFAANVFNGQSWSDQTAYMVGGSATTITPTSSRCLVSVSDKLYVFLDNYTDGGYALVKTSQKLPTQNSHWTLVFEKTNVKGIPVSCAEYNGDIYYLIDYGTYCELYKYSISGSTSILLRTFKGSDIPNHGVGDKLLVSHNGKLIITIPTKEIWELDSSTLTRLYRIDDFKSNDLTKEAVPYLSKGAVVADNKVWWGNLMYDGSSFHNTFKEGTDATTSTVSPLFTGLDDTIYLTDSVNTKKLHTFDYDGTSYKGTADKNYLILNNLDTVSGLDKLAYSMIVLFKPLISGQSIKIEYLTGELTSSATWTTLGTVSYSSDGGTVNNKTFYFGASVFFKKLWIRIKLEGGAGDTPVLNDVVMEYLPIPTYKKLWNLAINCGDEVKRLDGRLVETTGRELRSRIEMAWWTKAIVDYQDFDYASTQINGSGCTASATTITVDSTADFPEQGRIRAEEEEIFYTGKTPTTFTGCTRGARGTRAVAHSDNTVVNNAYKVIITDLSSRIPIALEDKDMEYVVNISVREA